MSTSPPRLALVERRERATSGARLGNTSGVSAALYPGSFDPVHLGHISVIERAARAFDQVVVAVVDNPNKPTGMFTVEDRLELLESSVRALANVRCVVSQGLTVDAARANRCDVVIRTGHKDEGDEWSMLAMNHLMTGARTIFFPPAPEHAGLSSSIVRSLISSGMARDAAALVPAPVAAAIAGSGDVDSVDDH